MTATTTTTARVSVSGKLANRHDAGALFLTQQLALGDATRDKNGTADADAASAGGRDAVDGDGDGLDAAHTVGPVDGLGALGAHLPLQRPVATTPARRARLWAAAP